MDLNKQTSQDIAVLRIARGIEREEMAYEEFEVPFEPGASVLDGLIWVRAERDASLAFRYSCISANVCKECVLLIDGRAAYACTERLKSGPTILEPLANKTLVRDLACETIPPKERI